MNKIATVIHKRLLFGAFPEQKTINELKEYGITTIVNLVRRNKNYKEYTPTGLNYIYFPIKDQMVPTDAIKFQNFILDLVRRYKEEENIYIHCVRGDGRAGMITAILTKIILDITTEQALLKIHESYKNSIETKEKWTKINTQYSKLQIYFIKTYFSEKIDFYDKNFIFFEFSNFYLLSIEIDGIEYKSSEHYYQSQKFVYKGATESSVLYSKIISNLSTPGKAYYLAKQIKSTQYKWMKELNDIIDQFVMIKLDPNWDNRKLEVMEKVLLIKFENKKLRQLLLGTKNKEIREISPRDYYWGTGKDNSGLNNLGKLLMKIRDNIIKDF